ncbi:MAG: hypothetical protein WBV33_20790, partial [Terracidiphilus sp.]
YMPVFSDSSGDLGKSLLFETPKYVGIGTKAPLYPLSVAGVIQSSAGGFRFPDGTTQTSAVTLPITWKGAAKAPAGVLNVTDTTNGPAASGSVSFSTVPSAIVGTSSGSGVSIGVLGRAASTNSSAFGVGLMGYVPAGSHGGALIAYSNDGNDPVVQATNAATTGNHTIYAGDAYGPAMNGFNITYYATPVTGTPFSASAKGTNFFSVDGGGNIKTSGGLSVQGPATLSGGLSVSGATSLKGGIVGGLTVNNGMKINNLTTPNNIALEVTSGLKVDGNLWVNGSIQKGSGTFIIDHPLDPANKFLSHSFVESPDMMNIYNGNVVTDSHGFATVELPGYFEALNQDFRYQLTVIGQFAQAIVAQEIANNRFTIQTDKPQVKVSWQVTGIRHDAYAEAHRVKVEEDKPAGERGTYLHPELFLAKPDVANRK